MTCLMHFLPMHTRVKYPLLSASSRWREEGTKIRRSGNVGATLVISSWSQLTSSSGQFQMK